MDTPTRILLVYCRTFKALQEQPRISNQGHQNVGFGIAYVGDQSGGFIEVYSGVKTFDTRWIQPQ